MQAIVIGPFVRSVLRAVAAAALAFWGIIAAAAYLTYSASDIPGSAISSSELTVRFRPNLSVRRDVVYRSRERFNKMYTWYSRRFNLGAEQHATGACSLIARSGTVLFTLDQSMSVMMCDTPQGPMAFVARTLTVRYPAWLRTAITRW